MHYENQANYIFYVLAAIATLILSLGIVGMVHFWRLGKAKPLDTEINVSKWIASILKASFLETQILEYGILAWLSHMMIFLSLIHI